MAIPIGYRFKPTDIQLLSFYLARKVLGQTLPCPYPRITDKYIYRDHPSSVFWSLGESHCQEEETERYFFTFLETVSVDGTNIKRSVGDYGTWGGDIVTQKYAKNRQGNTVLIGYCKYYKFVTKDKGLKYEKNVKKGLRNHNNSMEIGDAFEWSMKEWSLPGHFVCPKENKNMVLCRINRVDKANRNIIRGSNSSSIAIPLIQDKSGLSYDGRSYMRPGSMNNCNFIMKHDDTTNQGVNQYVLPSTSDTTVLLSSDKLNDRGRNESDNNKDDFFLELDDIQQVTMNDCNQMSYNNFSEVSAERLLNGVFEQLPEFDLIKTMELDDIYRSLDYAKKLASSRSEEHGDNRLLNYGVAN